MEAMEVVPGGILTLAVRVTSAFGINSTPYNTMLTNVPGPPNQLYFAGARSVEGFGLGPLVPGVGLFHTASSAVIDKQGKMLLSFYACREMMPRPERYRACILESHAELRDATIGAKDSQLPETTSASASPSHERPSRSATGA